MTEAQTATATTHAHAMRREIYEQPTGHRQDRRTHLKDDIIFPGSWTRLKERLLTFEKLIIAASGSSRHAGLAGEIMIEDLSGVAVDVEYASEYCYRSTHAAVDPIVMVITQSGETADTIAAQREALTRGAKTIAISNVDGTTIVRDAGAALITGAGPELAVPCDQEFHYAADDSLSDGAFSGAQARTHDIGSDALVPAAACAASASHRKKPRTMGRALAEQFAARHFQAEKFLYLGRGVHYAIAREGALKLKEISYAHAEGYPCRVNLNMAPMPWLMSGCR
jgi:glucosamine--fructose-6-phosphate aminotransferase (isomerizing)